MLKTGFTVCGFFLVQNYTNADNDGTAPKPIPPSCPLQSGRVVKAYEYYQTCIATKTFEFFGFLSEARNDTPNLTTCCTNVPNLILLEIGHLCSSFVQVFP